MRQHRRRRAATAEVAAGLNGGTGAPDLVGFDGESWNRAEWRGDCLVPGVHGARGNKVCGSGLVELSQLLEVAVQAVARATQGYAWQPDAGRTDLLAARLGGGCGVWLGELNRLETSLRRRGRDTPELVEEAELLVADCLATELVGRVWGAWRTALEYELPDSAISGAVSGRGSVLRKCVLNDLLPMRGGALELTLELGRVAAARGAGLNRLRRRLERWTDLLAGPFVVRGGAGRFTHRVERAWELGREGGRESSVGSGGGFWEAVLLGVRGGERRNRLKGGKSCELRLGMLCQMGAFDVEQFSPGTNWKKQQKNS